MKLKSGQLSRLSPFILFQQQCKETITHWVYVMFSYTGTPLYREEMANMPYNTPGNSKKSRVSPSDNLP